MGIPISYTLVAFSTFYDEVLPEIPGYQKSLVDQMIRESAIDFCRRTRAWQETVPVDVVADDPSYAITPASQAVFMEVRRAAYNGKRLDVFRPEEKDAESDTWRLDTGEPTHYYAGYDEDEVFLYPIPAADLAGGLEVDAVFVPARTCTQLPSFLFDRHSAVIAQGAKYRLMAMAKKPWTDRALALAYRAQVEAQIGVQAWRTALGRTRAPARVSTVHGVK